MNNFIQFDESKIDWKPLPGPDGEPADHISLSFLNVDEKAKIVDILFKFSANEKILMHSCLLYTSPSPRDKRQSRMPSSA